MIYSSLTKLFLVIAAFGCFVSAYQMPPQCGAQPRVRMSWDDMTATQRSKYISALQCVKDSGDYDNLARQFANITAVLRQESRGNAMFFPVLRAFLKKFSDKMFQCDNSVVIAYYDWSLVANRYTLASIWNDFGRPNGQGCISGGQFASWRYGGSGSNSRCIVRSFGYGDSVSAGLPGPQVLGQLIRDNDDLIPFSRQVQLQIFLLHLQLLGGGSGTLNSITDLAQDPVFYLLITYLDRLYSDWQFVDPPKRLLQYGTAAVDVPIYNIEGLTVSDVLNTFDLCYTYLVPGCRQDGSLFAVGPPVFAIPPASNATMNNTTSIAPCAPISSSMIMTWNVDVSIVRSCEKTLINIQTNVTIIIQSGKQCFGPGAVVPANYTGTNPYPQYGVAIADNCKIDQKDIPVVVPSYGQPGGFGNGSYIRSTDTLTSGASEASVNMGLTAALISISMIIFFQ